MDTFTAATPPPDFDAIVLLGRGMPLGEQQLSFKLFAERLRTQGFGGTVRTAFLEITEPALTQVLTELACLAEMRRVLLVPAFVPWDRNIRSWLPRFLAGWLVQHAPHMQVMLAGPLDDSPHWHAALGASIAAAAGLPELRASHRPLYRRNGRSSVPALRHQVLVCLGPRCAQAGAWEVLHALRTQAKASGVDKVGSARVIISRTACQEPCNLAPLVTVQPDNCWYGHVQPADCERLVEQHLIGGEPVAELAHRPGGRPIDDDLAEPEFPRRDARIGALRIEGAYARPAMHLHRAVAAFMVLHNDGASNDALVAAAWAGANGALVHGPGRPLEDLVQGRFRPLVLPAGGSVVLEPGQLHLMLTGITCEPIEGDALCLDLMFEHAGWIALELIFHPAPLM
ncbi:MAG: copper chaperone PCu(A)C [Rhodoferax sp.]